MPTFYSNVAVVECADAAGLEELIAAGLQRFVVRRLGERAAVVDHERLAEIKKLFERLGQTPRITRE